MCARFVRVAKLLQNLRELTRPLRRSAKVNKSWLVDLSAAEQNNTPMIKLIEVGARRSVRGMPVPARALAPQPLPHVL